MTKVKLSPLELLYQEAKDIVEDETDALKRNITKIFWDDIKNKIEHKELITLTIRGIVRKGKSTGGIAILHQINRWLQKETNLKQIFSDQIEWTEFVTKTQQKNVCVLCDEYSKIGEGSYNATTEQQLFTAYLEMFAVNYIHTIFITPSHSYNEHATIILDVIAKDEENKRTHFKLLYKNRLEGRTVCLGRIEITVENILEKDFYKKYLLKKQARLDLLNKHGIRDIRDMIFSRLTLQTYNELLPLARTTKLTAEIVNIAFSKIARKNKTILSMISEANMINRIRGLLNMKITINKEIQKKKELQRKERYKEAEETNKDIQIMQKQFSELIQELKELNKIYEEYKNIGG